MGLARVVETKKRNRGYNKIVNHTKKEWDNEPPPIEYFQELHRVCKNVMIFGANYFVTMLPMNTMGWVFWDKRLGGDFSDGELIYSTFKKALRKFELSCFADLHGGHDRIHPTQKPVRLYTWILANYAKAGDLILDTHVGSASSLVACHQMGFDVVGCELDEEYYQLACERIKNETAQLSLF